MRTYKIAICEDDENQNAHLAEMIQKSCTVLSDENSRYEITDKFYSYDDAIKALSSNCADIYFLDIQLSDNPDDANGIELANFIRNQQENAQIIFMTTHDELALLTFERQIEALDYIIKNDNEEKIQAKISRDLEKASTKISEFSQSQADLFTYQVGNGFYRININDIYYISTTPFPHRLKIVANNEVGEFTGDIKNVQDEVPKFIKVSQSYLVNMENIARVDLKKRLIIFPSGEEIQFAFSAKRKIKQYFEK